MATDKGNSWRGSDDFSRPNSSTEGTKGQAPAANTSMDWHGVDEMTRPTSSPSSDKVTLVGDKSGGSTGTSGD